MQKASSEWIQITVVEDELKSNMKIRYIKIFDIYIEIFDIDLNLI